MNFKEGEPAWIKCVHLKCGKVWEAFFPYGLKENKIECPKCGIFDEMLFLYERIDYLEDTQDERI
jgi:hypothetical protein